MTKESMQIIFKMSQLMRAEPGRFLIYYYILFLHIILLYLFPSKTSDVLRNAPWAEPTPPVTQIRPSCTCIACFLKIVYSITWYTDLLNQIMLTYVLCVVCRPFASLLIFVYFFVPKYTLYVQNVARKAIIFYNIIIQLKTTMFDKV